ncbi:putative gustatory receptor 28b [Homalodisca vitripennis]|uniref:putative gustatory receptor 28b n=1 Tax=Homalodisca vitripennis TaxID=197043 RepID=UPI001EE9B809|nr:putative gustatory receptor 28b [Homalodisca vitripennis]
MIWFSRIVGGLPLKPSPKIRGLAFSITAFLWSAALVMLQEFLSSSVLYMYFMERQGGQTLHPFSRTTDFAITLHVVSLQVTVAVVFFSSARKYPRLVDVLDTLERVYRDHQCKTSEVKVTVKLWGICTIALTLATIAAIITPSLEHGVFSVRELLIVLDFVFMSLLNCSEVSLFVHFTHVTHIIAKCFRMVNARIRKELISNVIERMHMNNTLPDVDFTRANRTVLSRSKELRTLMNTYWMLCDAVHQANVFYCDQLMAVIFTSFVHVTITFYYCFLNLTDGKVISFTTEGARVLNHIFYVFVLMNSSTDVTNSADETEVLICKFMNKDLDPILKKQLEGFLLQLPHHNARFSALGYFPINNETLTAMAGAVTTYLVILIQFQLQPSST